MEGLSAKDIAKAIDKLKEYDSKPKKKWLIYPISLVDAAGGVDKVIEKIYGWFGVRMKLKEKSDSQYIFEEVWDSDR